MKNMKKKILISFLLGFLIFNSKAQKTIVKAELNKVEKSGFYKIPLSIEFRSYLNTDFSNLRIIDSAGKEQAFYIDFDKPKQYVSESLNLKIISRKKEKKHSHLIIKNQEKLVLKSIQLEIKNAFVSKEMTIEGSADLENWYALLDKTYIYCSDSKQLSCTLPITLPSNDFPYLRISLNDSLSAPILVENVFCVKQDLQNGSYNSFSKINFSQKDSSDKCTYINIELKRKQEVNKIAFFVSGLPFYNRKVSYSSAEDTVFSSFKYFTILNSNAENLFDFEDKWVKKIRFKIENDDNPALIIDSIQMLQSLKNAVVYLNNSNTYYLLAGNDTLQFPNYDIVAFKQKLPNYLPIIHSKIISIETLPEIIKPKTEISIFNNKLFIWSALILVGGLLVYISFRMLTEMKSKS